MKAVLISIQPKWVEKIASGEKTVEVRKSRPKLETPFKCYIYCTKNTPYNPVVDLHYKKDGKFLTFTTGKVIGEFVCDRIDSYVGKDDDNKEYWDLSVKEWEDLKKKSCLTIGQIIDYTGDSNNCYGWHISDLKIYDKPKGLSEFKHDTILHTRFNGYKEPLKKPPQSWCYVEELQNGH